MLSILILSVLFYNWHLNDYLYTIIYTRCLPVNSQPFLRSNHYQLYGVTRRRRTRLSSTSINSRFPIKPLLHDTILIAPSTFLLFSYYYYGDTIADRKGLPDFLPSISNIHSITARRRGSRRSVPFIMKEILTFVRNEK